MSESVNSCDQASGWKKLLQQTVLLALIMMIGWYAYLYLEVRKLKSENPKSTSFMQDALAEMREQNSKAELKQRWVNYKHISQNLKQAVIAAEDAAFMQHSGFDWQGIRVAMEKNIAKGRIAAGGSTISQQLAKNLFLSAERSWIRKAEETVITIMLESTLSKQRILELYLNFAEWGNGIYGAEAAARHHFGVPASRISSWQAARLAAILPNPRYYDGRRTDWIYEKTDLIIERMPKVRLP